MPPSPGDAPSSDERADALLLDALRCWVSSVDPVPAAVLAGAQLAFDRLHVPPARG